MIMMVPSDLKVYEYWPVSVSPPSHRTPLLISVTWAYSRGRTRLLFRPSSLRCYPKEPQPPPWYSPSSCPGLAPGTSRASSCSGRQILRGGIPPKSRVAWLPFFFLVRRSGLPAPWLFFFVVFCFACGSKKAGSRPCSCPHCSPCFDLSVSTSELSPRQQHPC